MDIQAGTVSGEIFQATSRPTSLQPREEFRVTPELRALLFELELFDAPYLEECLLSKGIFREKEEFRAAFLEFKKFVVLNLFSSGPVAMSSPEVDEVWHQFILFTRQYVSFCERFLGHYLHHEPATPFMPVDEGGKVRFFELYQEIFGDVSSLWMCGQRCSSCWTCKSDAA
jgi:hypothetical protein